MNNLFNLDRESHLVHYKKVSDKLDEIKTWISSNAGINTSETIQYIKDNLPNLNDKTKKSLYEYVLDNTNTRIIEVNKLNDFMILLNEL